MAYVSHISSRFFDVSFVASRVCCSVLVAVCRSVLQRVAMCCGAWQCIVVCRSVLQCNA